MGKVALSGKYKAYSKYKDSGVEWLGLLPINWVNTSVKRYCSVTDGSHHSPKTQSSGMPFVSVTDVGVNEINFEDSKKITHEDYLRLVQEGCKPNEGDVLLTKDGTIGRAVIVTEDFSDFVILSSLGLLTPTKKLFNIFLYYYLISGVNVDQMNSMIHGSALRRMTINKIDSLIITIPPIEEQQKIANFLDHETAKIDTLIEKQQELIKLLLEKRQAVISHAVTKGLNPNAPMRDSGVECLGEVPEHWNVSRVKQISNFITSGPRGWSDYLTDHGANIFLQSGDLDNKLGLKLSEAKRVNPPSNAEGVRTKLESGDVIVCITGANTGRVAIAPEFSDTVYINQHLSLIRPVKALIDSDYLGLSLSSSSVRSYFSVTQYGLKEGLSLSNVGETPICRPPLVEQIEIVHYVRKVSNKYDVLVLSAEKQIGLLQERRTALISAAVTGKIDVRHFSSKKWQAA